MLVCRFHHADVGGGVLHSFRGCGLGGVIWDAVQMLSIKEVQTKSIRCVCWGGLSGGGEGLRGYERSRAHPLCSSRCWKRRLSGGWARHIIRGENCECAGSDPPQWLGQVENFVPFVFLGVVLLYYFHHAPIVPRVAAHHVNLILKHGHAHVALTSQHGGDRCPQVEGGGVVFAAEDVVVVAGAPEMIASDHVKTVAHRAHAVEAANCRHGRFLSPFIGIRVKAHQLLLKSVVSDSTCSKKKNIKWNKSMEIRAQGSLVGRSCHSDRLMTRSLKSANLFIHLGNVEHQPALTLEGRTLKKKQNKKKDLWLLFDPLFPHLHSNPPANLQAKHWFHKPRWHQ